MLTTSGRVSLGFLSGALSNLIFQSGLIAILYALHLVPSLLWSLAPVPPNWKSGGYLEKLPKDPWGRPYQYISPGSHGEIDVYSLGKDGEVGGEGIDADFGNWSD